MVLAGAIIGTHQFDTFVRFGSISKVASHSVIQHPLSRLVGIERGKATLTGGVYIMTGTIRNLKHRLFLLLG
jgi:hypothetical protein